MSMRSRLAALACIVLGLAALQIITQPLTASEIVVRERSHEGVTLIAVEPQAARYDGVKTVQPEAALDILQSAFDRLMKSSPATRARIERLKANGKVQVAYDWRFPSPSFSTLTLGLYFPEFYDPSKGRNAFLVAITRAGIHWGEDEMAATLAHELAGHATQRLEGRDRDMRPLDLECEAFLIEEQAKQDMGYDKFTDEAIGFRRAMDRHWCDDFRRWSLSETPDEAEQWNQLDPDVPTLLSVFPRYLEIWR